MSALRDHQLFGTRQTLAWSVFSGRVSGDDPGDRHEPASGAGRIRNESVVTSTLMGSVLGMVLGVSSPGYVTIARPGTDSCSRSRRRPDRVHDRGQILRGMARGHRAGAEAAA